MSDRAGHCPPITHAWLWLCVALALAAWAPGRAGAAPFAATVMDARTGEILHSVNDRTRLHPASLTKMMTLYVAFEAIRNGEISLDTMVRISRRAASEPPSRLGLRSGQRVALRHLIRAAALRSGNDAATAIAEAVSGSVEAFARRMNRTAAAIGMTDTQFRNAHGLTQSGHYSSARDMTILGRQIYFDFPEYYGLFSRRSEDAGIATVRNTNSRFLDGYAGADGIKTGFTSAAGYNLTAMAERNGVRIVVTVFGGRSIQHRHERVTALMDRGFREAPRRAALRRPGRPDYQRPAPVPDAGTEQVAAPTEGRAAGRVIRLQTAPSQSPFPRRRPSTDAPVSDALLAQVQTSVGAALADVAASPPAEVATVPPPGDVAAVEVPPANAPPAPDRSPVPRERPVAVAVAADPATQAPSDVEAARAVGFSVIDPEAYAALTALPEVAPEAPPTRETDAAVAAALVPDETLPETTDAPPAPVEVPQTEVAAAEPPQAPPPPLAIDLTGADTGPVQAVDGQIVIPGLPAIPLATPEMQPTPLILPALGVRPEPALVVTAEGQILWHDEDLLTALDDVAPQVAGPGAMVLTDSSAPQPSPASQPPQVVVNTSTSGGQVWAVDLGAYPSRFEAEHAMLSAALAEVATLGAGVRRVDDRGRGYRAVILSLTEDQSARACARLAVTGQACEVVAP